MTRVKEPPVTIRDIWTARLRAVDANTGFPYLAEALLALIPIFTDKVPTLSTDRYWRMYINPNYFASLTAEQGAMVLVHEVWHVLLEHFAQAEMVGVRREERDIANIAMDLVINQLDDLWKRLPADACKPDLFDVPPGLGWIDYFQLLKQQQPQQSSGDNGEGQDGKASGPGQGKCGSCAHNHAEDFELPPPGVGDDGEVIPGITKARADVIVMNTAVRILEASQSIGSVPGGWVRWAKDLVDPQIDWRQALPVTIKGMMAPAFGQTYTNYRRISRRQHMSPRIVKPARSSSVPRVAMIIDTSGSMSDDMLTQGVSEVDGVLRALGYLIVVDVYFTDAAANPVQRCTSASNLIPYGGGGTDMGEGFKAIEKRAAIDPDSEPALIIVVTDCYTPWPESPPVDSRVLVVHIGGNGTPPSWAVPPDHDVLVVPMGARS